jgi:hypothetical protein
MVSPDEGADNLKELFFLFELNQLTCILEDDELGAGNLLRQQRRRTIS